MLWEGVLPASLGCLALSRSFAGISPSRGDGHTYLGKLRRSQCVLLELGLSLFCSQTAQVLPITPPNLS